MRPSLGAAPALVLGRSTTVASCCRQAKPSPIRAPLPCGWPFERFSADEQDHYSHPLVRDETFGDPKPFCGAVCAAHGCREGGGLGPGAPAGEAERLSSKRLADRPRHLSPRLRSTRECKGRGGGNRRQGPLRPDHTLRLFTLPTSSTFLSSVRFHSRAFCNRI